jgi:hypothetical protein
MGVLLTLILAMVVWVVLWAIGGSGFDGFLVALVIMLLAAGGRVIAPFLPGNKAERE